MTAPTGLPALPAKVERLRAHLDRLRELPIVGDVRQKGLMAGIELVRDRRTREPFPAKERMGARACRLAREQGVLLRPLGDVVVVMPPLAIDFTLLDRLGDVLYNSCKDARQWVTSMRGLFITATDTGAGKTFVTAVIARTLRQQGHGGARVQAGGDRGGLGRRPLAERGHADSGRGGGRRGLRADNALGVPDAGRAAGGGPAGRSYVAAGGTGRARCGGGRRRRRWCWWKGSAVCLCPLTEDETVADLAAELGLPLVVVARRSLGTLNHTLLTLEVARARRLRVAGVVVSETTPVTGPAEETNVEELRRRIGVPLLAVVPHRRRRRVLARRRRRWTGGRLDGTFLGGVYPS